MRYREKQRDSAKEQNWNHNFSLPRGSGTRRVASGVDWAPSYEKRLQVLRTARVYLPQPHNITRARYINFSPSLK